MVDVVGANAKLRQRAAGIVAEVAGCDPAVAERALAACSDDARAAVLSVVGGLDPAEARQRATSTESLRRAIADLSPNSDSLPPAH
jgi:N-acetylmuramic acid 6-phosphate etherase